MTLLESRDTDEQVVLGSGCLACADAALLMATLG